MPPVSGPFPKLYPYPYKTNPALKAAKEALKQQQARGLSRAGAGIIMAVSLSWLAFAVFHSPFLTAFFGITTLVSGAVLIQPPQIQAAKGKLKEVFKAAGNKIRASVPEEKSRSNVIKTKSIPIGLERPTQGEVQNVQYLLRKEFRSVDVSVEERVQHLENIASDMRQQVENVTKKFSDHINVQKLDKPRFPRPAKIADN